MVRKMLLGFLCFLLFALIDGQAGAADNHFVNTLRESKYIAHAMGEVNGNRHTNSWEAFLENYKKGFRIFEVDLILTSDWELAARHDWNAGLAALLEQNLPEEVSGTPLSLEEFKMYKINRELQPLTFTDIVYLLSIYRDAYIITDTKTTDMNKIKEQFSLIKKTALDIDPSVIERIIPQIYNEKMFYAVKEIYPFKDIIYTLYQTKREPEEILYFSIRENIRFVAMNENRFSDEFIQSLSRAGIDSMIYTLNDREIANQYFEKGVAAVYTDQLLPKDYY